ncbi:MAG: hypothetical protein QOE63_2104 [Acidimicrobiaceae bacterium]
MNKVDPADERAHEPGQEQLWSESWYFDFFAPDGSLGGWVRLGLYPNLGVAWYHAYVVGPDRRTLAVQDLEVPLPRKGSLELRTHGLWADHTCETPLDHWSLGNEAFALAVDDPADLYAAEPRGEQVPMGLDLEWETDGEPHHYLHTTRYEIPCRVHGEVLVGAERIELDGWGQRDHSWGVRDWWAFPWVWCAGRLDEGTRFHGSDIRVPNVDIGFGYQQPGDATNDVHAGEQLGEHGFPTAASIAIADLELTLDPIAFAPALLTFEDKVDRFPRALCRVTAADGRPGWAWTEWNQPQP